MVGKSRAVTSKRLQNVYLEFRPAGEKVQVCAFGTAGLDLFDSSYGETPHRGQPLAFEPANLLFTCHRGVFYEESNAGVRTVRGALLTTTGTTYMAHNGTQVMIVDGTYGYIYNTVTNVFTQIVAGGFPVNPQTVTFMDGYFIVNSAGTLNYQISGLYDGLTWDALDVGTAESNPDPIVRVFADHGQLIPFGSVSLEFHSNTGANDFPFARIQGAVPEWGLGAINSVVKFDNSVAFLATNKMGQFQVVRLNGFTPQRISNSDVENQINGFSVASDATAYAYLQDGHPFYQLNLPSAGYSFLFDGSTGEWSWLKSAGITRHRAEYGVSFLNSIVVTDYSNGNLYRLNPETYTDAGSMIEREIVGEHWDDPELARVPIDKIRLDLEGGVGLTSGQGRYPQISMQCSKDRGNTWGVERWKPIGAIGQYATKVEWSRWGRSRNWTFKMRMTDPDRFAVLGAILNPID